jgi:hypothetical protein
LEESAAARPARRTREPAARVNPECSGWDQRAEQHQSANKCGMLRRDEDAGPCRHGIAHQYPRGRQA